MHEASDTKTAESRRMVVVSGDSHVGPRLVEELRPYCPRKYLEEFDRFIRANSERNTAERALIALQGVDVESDILAGRSTQASEVAVTRRVLNRKTPGHYDVSWRLREMDWEGVAAEVIFHGSQNTEPYPFVGFREWATPTGEYGRELTAVGHRMYNSWLADFCAAAPERLIGLAYLPMWDVDEAVKELHWAARHGLRGVNFPAPREGVEEYDNPIWEPFWRACEERGMTLATHAGLPSHSVSGPQALAMTRLEAAGWPCRRGMVRMIFGGVFERYPSLKLVLAELSRGWWRSTMRELDFVYSSPSEELHQQVAKRPSEYMATNVFLGESFMPPAAVREAIEDGYSSQVIWGRDYPHGEGTYKYPEQSGEESTTRRYMRWAFAGTPMELAMPMLSETAIYASNLNGDALSKTADRIGPAPRDVVAALEHGPSEWANSLVDTQTGEVAEGFVPLRGRAGG